MLEVGLKATRNTMGAPFEMPPLIPPAPFFTGSISAPIGSLCSDPFILEAAKPSPNSMPLTPGMEKIAWEIRLSTESQKGSPRPMSRF